MNKRSFLSFNAVLFFLCSFVPALHAQVRLAVPNDPNAQAGRGQSEIILNAQNSDRDIAVWVDGIIAAHISPRQTEKIIVTNGGHTVEAADTTLKRGQWETGEKRQINISSSSNRITLTLTTRYSRLLTPSIQSTVNLIPDGAVAGGPAAPASPDQSAKMFTDNSLDDAIDQAVQEMLQDLPSGSTLAILGIASADREMADYVMEEFAYHLVDTRRFKVLDRQSLDLIRAEHDFQVSGDVDDASAVSIGKLLGASIVFTGSVSGSGSARRLRIKALDVKTAEILSMASERF